MSTETEQFEQEGRTPGTGSAAFAIRFPRAGTLARPPGKDGEMTVPLDTVNDIRSTKAPGVQDSPGTSPEPQHRGEVRRHRGHVTHRDDTPKEGQADTRVNLNLPHPLIYRHEKLNHFPSMHANSRPNNRMTHHSIRGPQTSSELEPDRRKQFTQFKKEA